MFRFRFTSLPANLAKGEVWHRATDCRRLLLRLRLTPAADSRRSGANRAAGAADHQGQSAPFDPGDQ